MIRLGLEVWEVGIELAEENEQEILEPQEQRKFEQTRPGSIEVGCTYMTLRSDSCSELMHNADAVTVVRIVTEVQMLAKRSLQEMMPDAIEIDIAIAVVDSTVVIVHESAAAKRRKVGVTMEFLEVPGKLLDSPALEEPIGSSLC